MLSFTRQLIFFRPLAAAQPPDSGLARAPGRFKFRGMFVDTLSGARLAAVSAVLCLSACETTKKITGAIPRPPLPDVTKLKRVLPGTEDRVNDKDPNIPFEPRETLRAGHTLRLEIRESLRSAKSLWKGLAMVEMDGLVEIGKFGKASVRGMTLPQAARAIETAVRSSGRTASPLAVHIISVENVTVILLDGDLAAGPQPLPVYEGITVAEAIRLAGGRTAGSTNRGVYITREGRKKFFRSAEAADTEWRIAPGDIITLSKDI
jgi:hypothetical protein